MNKDQKLMNKLAIEFLVRGMQVYMHCRLQFSVESLLSNEGWRRLKMAWFFISWATVMLVLWQIMGWMRGSRVW